MTRRRNSMKAREACLEAHAVIDGGVAKMQCTCGYVIWTDRDEWHADHIVPFAVGGSDEAENLQPLCVECHAKKTGQDWPRIAKSSRIRAKHFGIREKRSSFRRLG